MPAERKRPWYLVLALLGALALGMTGACNGWAAVTLYREPVDVSLSGQGISDPADRAAVEARVDSYVRTLDGAKTRGWPIAVAGLLLGGAMVVFSMRALGGSRGARAVLVQLAVAQAGLNAASYWLLRDVMDADLFIETFLVGSWEEHERQHARLATGDREVLDRLDALLREGRPRSAQHSLGVRPNHRHPRERRPPVGHGAS